MSQSLLYIAPTLESSGIPDELRCQSADVEHFVDEAFGIKEARALRARADALPSVRPTRDFVIHFNTITIEAQNALLKLLEEPVATSNFHLVVAMPDILLPTVRSRLHLVGRSDLVIDETVFNEFYQQTKGERLNEIAKRLKNKDRAWMEALVSGSESWLATGKQSQPTFACSLLYVRSHLGNRGAANKMLLEELALSLPAV